MNYLYNPPHSMNKKVKKTYILAYDYLNRKKIQQKKDSLIKEIEEIDVSTMTYGAFRRKVLEIIKK